MARKEQQIINNATGAVSYVTVDPATTFETKHPPTSAELASQKSALPSGYTWSIVGPTQTVSYNRIVYLGNSILQHGGTGGNSAPGQDFVVNDANPSRGMAATRPEKDFFRLLSAKHVSANPSAVNRRMSDFGAPEQTLSAVVGPFLEDLITQPSNNFYNEINDRFALVQAWAPDLFYYRIGENVDDGEVATMGQAEYRTRTKALIDKIIAGNPSAKVVLSTSVWDKPNHDQAIRAIAAERNYPLADFAGMWQGRNTNGYYAITGGTRSDGGVYNDQGINEHPDDDGMAYIADKLWSVTPGQVTAPPTAPSSDFIITANQPWGSSDIKYLENDLIKVGFRASVGATISHLSLKEDGIGRVNDLKLNENGTIIVDKGRQIQFGSDYFSPRKAYLVGGDNTSLHGFDTGGNVVQGGSQYPFLNPSTILASGIVYVAGKGDVFYAKVRAKIWGANNVDGHIILEENIWLNGRTVCYRARHTIMERDNTQVIWEGSIQENPCLYLTGPHTNVKSNLGNGNQTVFTPNFAGEQMVQPQRTLAHWVGAYDNTGKGVTVYQPHNSQMSWGYFPSDGGPFGNEDGGSSAYLNAAQQIDYDTPGVYDDEGYIIVGTESQAMAVIATLPAPLQSFNFDFSSTHQGWYGTNAEVRRVNGVLTGYMSPLRLGDNGYERKHGSFKSPARSWSASAIRYITLDIQATTDISHLRIQFQKPGQSEADAAQQSKVFNINSNGARQTVTFDMNGALNWSGVISTVSVNVQNPSNNESIKFYSIRASANP